MLVRAKVTKRRKQGAQWLHGAEESPLYKWLQERGLVSHFEDATVEMDGAFVSDTGQILNRKMVDRVFEWLMKAKISLSTMSADNVREMRDMVAVNYFKRFLAEKVSEDSLLRATPRHEIDALFRWFELYETIDNSASSMADVSIKSYLEWQNWGDGVLANFKRGNQSVVDELAAELTRESLIRTDCEVTKIEDGADSVQVCYLDRRKCAEGNERAVRARRVIFTGSVGVLKAYHARLFRPNLSEPKQELISSTGFGSVVKIFLEFEAPVFERLAGGVKLVWFDDGDDDGTSGELPAWTRQVTGFDVVECARNCLLAWVGGAGAEQVEALTAGQVGATCRALLARFLARALPGELAGLPALATCTCSRWTSNRFVQGAYSYKSLAGSSADSAGWLGDEFGGKLALAGEHTAGTLYSTTTGAIFSGWRAADGCI